MTGEWVQVFDHPERGTTEFVNKDPRKTLMERLNVSSDKASKKMAEAYNDQVGIELPGTEHQYLAILYPPDPPK